MEADVKVPNVAPPPIPGNLSTNPFIQMAIVESAPSSSRANVEKENMTKLNDKGSSIVGKEYIGEKEDFNGSGHSLGNNNKNNQSNTAHYEFLISKNNPRNVGLSSVPSLPPRTLSIMSSTQTPTTCTASAAPVHGMIKMPLILG